MCVCVFVCVSQAILSSWLIATNCKVSEFRQAELHGSRRVGIGCSDSDAGPKFKTTGLTVLINRGPWWSKKHMKSSRHLLARTVLISILWNAVAMAFGRMPAAWHQCAIWRWTLSRPWPWKRLWKSQGGETMERDPKIAVPLPGHGKSWE